MMKSVCEKATFQENEEVYSAMELVHTFNLNITNVHMITCDFFGILLLMCLL